MTARKIPMPRKVVTEVKPGTAFQPPQARSSMMKVAGATDDDPDREGERLITDDDETTMKGPVYDEGAFRLTVGQLREMVRRLARRA
jgi:hypothetical protein